jgi:hypothetical protein
LVSATVFIGFVGRDLITLISEGSTTYFPANRNDFIYRSLRFQNSIFHGRLYSISLKKSSTIQGTTFILACPITWIVLCSMANGRKKELISWRWFSVRLNSFPLPKGNQNIKISFRENNRT